MAPSRLGNLNAGATPLRLFTSIRPEAVPHRMKWQQPWKFLKEVGRLRFQRFWLFAAAALVAATGVAPTASADPLADLFALLPKGYAQGCHPVDSERPVALAAVDCDNRVFPGGGPAPGRYILYGDPETLERDFVAAMQEWLVPVPCPGRDGLGPSRWGPPDATAGSIACGTGEQPAYLGWTDDSGPYFGLIVGRDLGELMAWWVATIEQPTD